MVDPSTEMASIPHNSDKAHEAMRKSSLKSRAKLYLKCLPFGVAAMRRGGSPERPLAEASKLR